LAAHPLIHTADGELFREAILQASERSGLKTERVKEKELLETARKILRKQPAALLQQTAEMGKAFGSPWSQDEKFATLAAWLALRSKSSRNRSGATRFRGLKGEDGFFEVKAIDMKRRTRVTVAVL